MLAQCSIRGVRPSVVLKMGVRGLILMAFPGLAEQLFSRPACGAFSFGWRETRSASGATKRGRARCSKRLVRTGTARATRSSPGRARQSRLNICGTPVASPPSAGTCGGRTVKANRKTLRRVAQVARQGDTELTGVQCPINCQWDMRGTSVGHQCVAAK